MRLFKIIGTDSKLLLRLEHPLHLDEQKNYSIGLVGLYGENIFQNVTKPIEIIFHVKDRSKGRYGDKKTLSIGCGNYYVENLEKLIINFIKSNYPRVVFDENNKDECYIRVNPTTCKVEMKLPVDINLFPSLSDTHSNIGYKLGFAPPAQVYFKGHEHHSAEQIPKMGPFRAIEIHCNLVEPAITNHNTDPHSHQETDILYVFYPKQEQIAFGSIIAEKPARLSYVPINKSVKSIQTIELEIKNEFGEKLDIAESSLTVYLSLIENAQTRF